LTGDLDGAGARVHAEIGAAEFSRDEPTGPGNPAAQVQDGDPLCDAGLLGQVSNLSCAHEALLLDELTGRVGGHARPLQGPDERRTVVLVHGLSSRRRTGAPCLPYLSLVATNTEARCKRFGLSWQSGSSPRWRWSPHSRRRLASAQPAGSWESHAPRS